MNDQVISLFGLVVSLLLFTAGTVLVTAAFYRQVSQPQWLGIGVMMGIISLLLFITSAAMWLFDFVDLLNLIGE